MPLCFIDLSLFSHPTYQSIIHGWGRVNPLLFFTPKLIFIFFWIHNHYAFLTLPFLSLDSRSILLTPYLRIHWCLHLSGGLSHNRMGLTRACLETAHSSFMGGDKPPLFFYSPHVTVLHFYWTLRFVSPPTFEYN